MMSRNFDTKFSPPLIEQGSHLIAEFGVAQNGATLVVVGSLHGNEPSGVLAMRRVARKLPELSEKLRGRVFFLAGNSRALAQGKRFVGADLNRYWTEKNLAKNKNKSAAQIAEDDEQHELLKIFADILASAENELFALDLHTTSADGLPFATVGDTLRNRRFALKFPVTVLLGIEEQLDGTMLEYLNGAGAVTLGFEGGRHDAAEAIDNHEALIWLALVHSTVLAKDDAPDLEKQRRNLAKASGKLKIVEIRHREAVARGDEFEMKPGFENFDPVKRGQTLAKNKNGAITAAESGLILMPLYQKQGEDGFFIGREVAAFWLRLSAVLRTLKIGNLMHVLPGVRRHPADAESLIINTRVARFYPLQIFHLLGFRKRRWRDSHLVVSRRRHDASSPFKSKVKGEKNYGR